MTTLDGVRREAERRRMLEGRRATIRPLTTEDTASYAALELATGVDFRETDVAALQAGAPLESLAINAV